MKKCKFSVDHTIKFIKRFRKSINPNEGFLKQLQSYSDTLTSKVKEKKEEIWNKPVFTINKLHISCVIEPDSEDKNGLYLGSI